LVLPLSLPIRWWFPLLSRDAVELPVTAVKLAPEVLHRDLAQQSLEAGLTTISDYIGHNLFSALTKCCPIAPACLSYGHRSRTAREIAGLAGLVDKCSLGFEVGE